MLCICGRLLINGLYLMQAGLFLTRTLSFQFDLKSILKDPTYLVLVRFICKLSKIRPSWERGLHLTLEFWINMLHTYLLIKSIANFWSQANVAMLIHKCLGKCRVSQCKIKYSKSWLWWVSVTWALSNHAWWLACLLESSIWVSSTNLLKSHTGWPHQPPTEKVPNISEKLDSWWSIPQKGSSIGHFSTYSKTSQVVQNHKVD